LSKQRLHLRKKIHLSKLSGQGWFGASDEDVEEFGDG
jgi:hypothetical protein